MTTEPAEVPAMIGIARRIRDLVAEQGDEVVCRHIGADGQEPGFSWADLDRRSSQLAMALGRRGLGHGDRLGIGLRNSPQFLFSVFAAGSWARSPCRCVGTSPPGSSIG